MNTRLLSISLLALVTAVEISCSSGDTTTGAGGAASSSTASTSAAAGGSTSTSASSSAASTTASAGGSVSIGSGGAGEASCATTGKNLLLCEDFETIAVGGVPDPSVWSVDKGAGATVAVDGQNSKHGKHALHLHTLPDANKALLHETKTFPLPGGNSLYGRANVMIEAGTVVPNDHTNFFEASGKVNGVSGNYRYGSSGGKFLANYNPGDPSKASKTAVPVGVWSCIEWAFLGDTNEMHFWIDEKEITDLAVPSTGVNGMVWTAPKFDSFYFGWITYATDTASDHYDVWYDDIAIDTARIGCAE
jgi:polysaccharide lyase-like protein